MTIVFSIMQQLNSTNGSHQRKAQNGARNRMDSIQQPGSSIESIYLEWALV